jgi:PIN domain
VKKASSKSKLRKPTPASAPVKKPRFAVLIDTCVWLDLVKDRDQQPVLSALEELVREQEVLLVLPRTVPVEFVRHKARVVEDSTRSLHGTLKRVKEIVDKLGDPKKKGLVLAHLNEVDHKLPTLGEHAVETVGRIEKLFSFAQIIELNDLIRLRAAQRAIDHLAPFRGKQNNMADALIIETYGMLALDKAARGTRFMFITHNVKDFSAIGASTKLAHPDIRSYFSKIKSRYFTSLGEAVQRMAPDVLGEADFEHNFTEEPRGLSEILEAMDLLWHQVWYNRHWNLRLAIESGEHKLVDPTPGPYVYRPKETLKEVWKGALKAAAKVEKKYGVKNLGPWTDFEWGMLNGKLSALRWILGDEWDMLDT